MVSIGSPDVRWRLIIADDDPVIRSMMSIALDHDCEVVGVAANSEQAVELARQTQPAAAVLDVDMPKGGGIAAVRGITAVSPNTAIVMLSSDESDSVVRDLILAGADCYERKGVPTRMLVTAIRESVANRVAAEVTTPVLTSAVAQRGVTSGGFERT